MKLFTSILLICCFSAQSLTSFLIEVHFFLNQEEIIEEFCENKDQPMMECNGKCYLAKKLNQEPVNNTEAISVHTFQVEPAPFVIPSIAVTPSEFIYSETQITETELLLTHKGFTSVFLRPPIA